MATERSRRRASTAAGVASPTVLLTTLAVGALRSPRFRWPSDPFYVVGMAGDPAAPLFNAGLVGGGLLALAFAARLWRTHGRLVAGLYAVVGAGFALAGVFPAGSGVHDAAAAPAFLAAPLLLWTAAVGDRRAGRRWPALAWFGLGDAAVLVWLPYDRGPEWAWIGAAPAELVTLGALALWSVWTATLLWDDHEYGAGGQPATGDDDASERGRGTGRG